MVKAGKKSISQCSKLIKFMMIIFLFLVFVNTKEAKADGDLYGRFNDYESLISCLNDTNLQTMTYYYEENTEFGWPADEQITLDCSNKYVSLDNFTVPANVTMILGETGFSNRTFTVQGTVILKNRSFINNLVVEEGGTLIVEDELTVKNDIDNNTEGIVTVGGRIELQNQKWLFLYGSCLNMNGGTITGDGAVALRAGTIKSSGSEPTVISCNVNIGNYEFYDGDNHVLSNSYLEGIFNFEKGILFYEGNLVVNSDSKILNSNIYGSQGVKLIVSKNGDLNLLKCNINIGVTVEENGSLTVKDDCKLYAVKVENGGILNVEGLCSINDFTVNDEQPEPFVINEGGVLNLNEMAYIISHKNLEINGSVVFAENSGSLFVGPGCKLTGNGKLSGTGVVELRGNKDETTGKYSNVATISGELLNNKDNGIFIAYDGLQGNSGNNSGDNTQGNNTQVSNNQESTISGKETMTVIDNTNNGSNTSGLTVTSEVKTDKPAKVSKISLSSSKNKVIIKYKKSKGVSGYEIYRSNIKNKNFKKIKTTKKTTYKDNKGIKRGNTYYYKIRAYKIAGSSKVFSDYSKTVKIKVK